MRAVLILSRRFGRGVALGTLLLATLLLPLAAPAGVGAAICGDCYAQNSWYGQPGTWSGGATSITVPNMQLNSVQPIMNNTMWILGHIDGTWVESGIAVGAPAEDGPPVPDLQFYYAAQRNQNGVYRTRFLDAVPNGDRGQYINVYIFNNFNGTWSAVLESLNLGLLFIRSPWEGNTMQAQWQNIGLELRNGYGPEGYANRAYFVNNRWRSNSAGYYVQTVHNNQWTVVQFPLGGGWWSIPENGGGGNWYTETRQ